MHKFFLLFHETIGNALEMRWNSSGLIRRRRSVFFYRGEKTRYGVSAVKKTYSPKKYAPMNAPTVATKPIINTV